MSKRKILIDTDTGTDDAQAIFMVLSSPEVEVVGITVVQGNVPLPQGAKNVLRILGLVDRLDIPIYLGCELSLLGFLRYNGAYHGMDGLGDVPDPEPVDESLLKSESAQNAMIRLSKEYEGELTLICLGPLTNVASVISLDRQFGSRLKDCTIMGGNYYGRGNVTVSAEFNFYADPEAAEIVLNQLGKTITIAGYDVCSENGLTWEEYEEIRTIDATKVGAFMKKIEINLCKQLKSENSTTYIPCDEFAVAAVLRPNEVITEMRNIYATVELKGEHTYGQMVVNWNGRLQRAPNVNLITKMDKSLFLDMLRDALKWK